MNALPTGVHFPDTIPCRTDERADPTLDDWFATDSEGYMNAVASEFDGDYHLILAELVDEGRSQSFPGHGYARVQPLVERMKKRLAKAIAENDGWVQRWRQD